MPLDVYQMNGSSPALAVNMLIKHLKLPANLHEVNLRTGDHLKPEFIKINPTHTIPTITDDGFALWERQVYLLALALYSKCSAFNRSRTILRYLVNRYAADSDLYPNDPKKRAIVDRMLDFDLGTLYPTAAQWMYPPLLENKPWDSEKEKVLSDKLKLFDQLLESNAYAAGNNLTIADISLLASVSTFDAAGHDFAQYANIKAWRSLLEQELPYYNDMVVPYLELLRARFASYK
ncbi:glutathione S-transferase 1: isoform D-like protein [Dinothrombium tinctorium]|uniref:Glutathione S-transferase 1: isoform D-like protein n=1 Tax=Dinothrombium tinctorium TaxID=1965070 RepID=A0A3S3SPG2_9ACAR|nr:glutathione S-transferase 1: isoform D-like protein [Dinothrombium tinctorium]RWS05047.1 glutathione S-transferase 1: isoform D-like protein [Dinothrombium tinctorium]RWS17085.1 glutathione S-transferase 1: isoform D-like protein [Dinothrombium tinctorium]